MSMPIPQNAPSAKPSLKKRSWSPSMDAGRIRPTLGPKLPQASTYPTVPLDRDLPPPLRHLLNTTILATQIPGLWAGLLGRHPIWELHFLSRNWRPVPVVELPSARVSGCRCLWSVHRFPLRLCTFVPWGTCTWVPTADATWGAAGRRLPKGAADHGRCARHC
ncbi:RING finger protein 5 [Iris pallida]|uniref:RING finger protein 5 n=1 Tax=Iris pallida TaxID=29817 RepID=A0AAX6GLT2_IRIPA|nr:RING finger protein 5 [Iris pallida]